MGYTLEANLSLSVSSSQEDMFASNLDLVTCIVVSQSKHLEVSTLLCFLLLQEEREFSGIFLKTILNFILLLVKNQTLIMSESLGAKRETRERGIKREAVEIWEPKSYVFFFFFWKEG